MGVLKIKCNIPLGKSPSSNGWRTKDMGYLRLGKCYLKFIPIGIHKMRGHETQTVTHGSTITQCD